MILTDSTRLDNPIIFVNAAFTRITGYTFEEAVGRNCRFLQGPDTDAASVTAMRNAFSANRGTKLELLNHRKSGEAFWNELLVAPRVDEVGNVTGFVGILNDITERRRMDAEKTQLEARLESIMQNMPGYVFQRSLKTDGTMGIVYFSPSFANILGIPVDAIADTQDLWDHIHPDDVEQTRQSVLQSAAELSPLSLEFRITTPAGKQVWVRNYSTPRRLDTGDVLWDGVGLDVTAEKIAQDRLSYLAYHDPLTGLPNRALFESSMLQALTMSASAKDQVVVFKLDLDEFEEINDTVGRETGDTVLAAVAKRIADFTKVHAGYAARIGGDEFAILFRLRRSEDDNLGLAAALSRELAQPLILSGEKFSIDASIGVSVFSSQEAVQTKTGEQAVAELMKQASIALDAAKRIGRGMRRLYTSDMDDRQRNHLVLRQSLRSAVEEQQFKLHYHPLVDLFSGRIVGAEALVRWDHPDLGMQRPDVFIPLAESSGLILPLGAWVLHEAMRQVREWAGSGITVPKIAINISGLQLLDPEFVSTVKRALELTGARASDFEFELTEGLMIEASSPVLNVLWALKMMGFTLAVDDFGTGHSSFRYLRDFPVDKVKIDQTFVRQMVIDSSDASIVRAIIAVAKSLNLDLVAEGIETSFQRNFLRSEGCKTGQGYLFCLPLAAEDFGSLLERGVPLPLGPVALPVVSEQFRSGKLPP